MYRIIEKYFRETDEFNMKRALFIYSLLFLLLMSFTYLLFYSAGKGPFQFRVDGLTYYARIAYIGEYIRGVLSSFLINRTPALPFYDFRIGLGDDIFNFLWVGALNPIVFLTAPFFSVEHTEGLYWIICFSHMYFAGLAFILFCSYKKNDSVASACGAITYIFSGFALFYFLEHFHFITAMIILPVMFWTLERAFNEESLYPFILTTAVSIVINFYFTFMITVMLFIYGVVRFFDIYRRGRISAFCRVFCKCAAGYTLGVMLAAPFFLPIVFKFMGSTRGKANLVSPSGILYPTRSILYSLLYVFSPGGTWGVGASIVPVCFLATVCFFRRKFSFERGLRIFLLLFSIGIFSPVVTYILTLGSGAPADKRWSFIFPFIFAYIFVLMFRSLAEWEEKDENTCLVAVLVYSVFILLLHLFKLRGIDKYVFFSLIVISLTTLSLRYASRRWEVARRKILLLSIVLLSALANVYFLYEAKPVSFKDTFDPSNAAYTLYKKALLRSLFIAQTEAPDDSSFFRVDTTDRTAQEWKFSLLLRQYDLRGYGSLATKYPEYLLALENRGAQYRWMAQSCDEIASLESLFSVKYFAAEKGEETFAPYGFTEMMSSDDYSLFKNNYFLPIGYTYDSYITQAEYESYSALEKLEAQLQAVSLEKAPSSFIRNKGLKFKQTSVPCKISAADGLEWDGGTVKVNRKSAEIDISFKPLPNEEIYLRLQGLNVYGSSKAPAFFALPILSSQLRKVVYLAKNTDSRYHGGENFLIRLGSYSNSSEVSCKIVWPFQGAFKLDDIQVYAQPMDDYPAQINKLREDVLENIYVGNDKVSGTISLKKNKILCLSIPYSKGWHAKVDGKKAELLKANSLFMALPLEAGDHKIELEYCVPGLRLGLFFFALGAAIFSGMLIHDKRKKKLLKKMVLCLRYRNKA